MLHVIYLKLRLNQGQEWSSVTVSSLSKIILGVKNIVVEKVEIEGRDQDSQLIISARPHKREICAGAAFADKNHPDMTAETVFAGGVRLISAAE